jgi:hypothetical protein
MKWINARQLEDWADSTDARIALSELVSALVRASEPDPQSFRFPNGDSAQIPGYDGYLVAKGVAPFVPDGQSIWEFGTSTDYQAKAEGDYTSRTGNPGSINPNTNTFVFVTPRIWSAPISPKRKQSKAASKKKSTAKPRNKAVSMLEWVKSKERQRTWKNVVVLDAVQLETWLDAHPAVAAYFARYVLKIYPAQGILSVAEYWDAYASRTNPALVESVLLSGRERQVEEIVRQLAGPAAIHRWRAYSPDEVVAFTVAAIRSAADETRKFIESRTLILTSDEAVRLLSIHENMAFITEAGAVANAALLAKKNPTIVPLARWSPGGDDAQLLVRATAGQMGKAIATMGIPEQEAYRLARECGCSVTILARQRPSATAPKPAWADGAPLLLPAFFAGAWDANNVEDLSVVSTAEVVTVPSTGENIGGCT